MRAIHLISSELTNIANFLGIIGVIVILVVYFLLQANKLAPHKLPYSILNFVGSSLILFSLFYAWNLPSVIVEAVWSLISVYGIYKALKLRRG